jgi:small GTP-binding protein
MYKVIVIGDSGVGKTNLLGRWMEDRFNATSATINVEFATKTFKVQNKAVKVQLWDTAGQEQYRAVTRSYYRFARGALIVYDITSQSSFEKVNSWLQDVRDSPGNEYTQILLIGNKSDLAARREVPTEVGLAYSKENRLYFMETSALTGNNVHRAFQIILQEIHKINEKYAGLQGGSNVNENRGNVGAGRSVVLTGDAQPTENEGCSC